jgi:hypothetical protein
VVNLSGNERKYDDSVSYFKKRTTKKEDKERERKKKRKKETYHSSEHSIADTIAINDNNLRKKFVEFEVVSQGIDHANLESIDEFLASLLESDSRIILGESSIHCRTKADDRLPNLIFDLISKN